MWKERLWPNLRPFPGSRDIRSSAHNLKAGAFRIQPRRCSVCLSSHVHGPLCIVHRFMHAFMYVTAFLTSSLIRSFVNQYRPVAERPWFATLWVLTAVLMKLQVVWDMTQFRLVSSYPLSGGACCFRVQGSKSPRLGSRFLRNVDKYLPIGAASCARGLELLPCPPPPSRADNSSFVQFLPDRCWGRGLRGPKFWNFARRCPTRSQIYFYPSPICKSALTDLSLAFSSLNA